jgi:hypothetical protein
MRASKSVLPKWRRATFITRQRNGQVVAILKFERRRKDVGIDLYTGLVQ